MASSSNHPDAIARIQDYEYLYASNTNVSNFVSVKLSGYENYDIWKTQMLCLMEAHEMCWLVDDSGNPKDLSKKIIKKYGSLLKGWIFGSIKEDVLRIVVDPEYSAKDVWKKLKSCFDSTMTSKKDSTLTKVDTKIETQDNNMALEEPTTNYDNGLCSEISEATDEEATQIEKEGYTDSAASKVDKVIKTERDYAETETNKFRKPIADNSWFEEYLKPEERKALAENINRDGNTLIHIAIGMGRNEIIDSLISNLGAIDLTVIRNSDGSTVLHIAAIVGNAYAAKRLSRCNPRLLDICDNKGETPLDKAYKNEHLLTIAYLEKRRYGKKINKLRKLIVDENWSGLYLQLKERFLLAAKINSDGDRLLHIAVRVGDKKLISEILWSIRGDELTGKPNSDGSTALHIAAIVGNKKAAELLVKTNRNLLYTKDNEGHTPLDKANENLHRNVASLLVAADKEINKFRKQIVDGDWRAVYLKLKERNGLTENIDSDGNTLLHKAVEISRNDLVKKILPHISKYELPDMRNSDGSTALHIAAIVGNTDAAVLLVRISENLLDMCDNQGLKPLDKANEKSHLNTIEYLQEARHTPAVTNELRKLIVKGDWLKVYGKLKRIKALTEKIDCDGNTLLHKAVEISRNDLVKKILPRIHYHYRCRDLTEIKNSDGSTVLHVAAIVGNMDAVALLVKHDIKLLDIRDNEDKTPLDKANENEHFKNTLVNLQESAKKTEANELRQLILDGDWYGVIDKLHKRNALNQKINSDGNTLLHKVVSLGDEFLTEAILWRINELDLTTIKNSDGGTALHTAAIVGNTNVAKILVKRKNDLLHTKDKDGKTPLDKAYQNMHLDTIAYLLEATEDHEKGQEKGKEAATVGPERKKDADVEIGVDLLTNAISAKRYDVALNLIVRNPKYAVSNDNVLMAMARTFPTGLDYGERLIYPSLNNTSEMIVGRTRKFFNSSVEMFSELKESTSSILHCEYGFQRTVLDAFWLILIFPLAIGYWICHFIPLLLSMVYFPFFVIYLLLWKAAKAVPPVKNIEQKKKEYREAKEVLELVLKSIIEHCPDKSPDLYTRPILEAACQDAYEVVDQILGRWPKAIDCEDKNGYDIIQLATIHRSERIYNMIYIIGERKNTYRTKQDSSENNMLHLVGRLAPSNKLKRRTGAALQLQRELQWRQEVEKLVFPTLVTKENIFMETPEMVFTKEHETLVKEGENWIKTVAESCSITAALITTIVFAAAITVPGGSNQDTGIPVFSKKAAFTIFAIADAISLFSSATALLVFLSILTARFAEQDFLIRLPRRLIIGLCTLLISTTAMMVAFSATLFLVFSHQKRWVLAPICALAFVPIAFFFVLQFPLILDLFQSTYIFKFGKSDINKNSKLVQKDLGFIVDM